VTRPAPWPTGLNRGHTPTSKFCPGHPAHHGCPAPHGGRARRARARVRHDQHSRYGHHQTGHWTTGRAQTGSSHRRIDQLHFARLPAALATSRRGVGSPSAPNHQNSTVPRRLAAHQHSDDHRYSDDQRSLRDRPYSADQAHAGPDRLFRLCRLRWSRASRNRVATNHRWRDCHPSCHGSNSYLASTHPAAGPAYRQYVLALSRRRSACRSFWPVPPCLFPSLCNALAQQARENHK